MLTAAIYARYSSQLQRATSIEDQVRLCRDAAARFGCDVGRVIGYRRVNKGLQDYSGLDASAEGDNSIPAASTMSGP